MASAFETFRDRYPDGCVISDLVTIQDGCYVIRTTIVNEGKALATGFAADANVQTAEDQARQRAIALVLPLLSAPDNSASSPQPPALSGVSSQQLAKPSSLVSETLEEIPLESEEIEETEKLEAADIVEEADIEVEETADIEEDLGLPIDLIAESAELVDESLTAAANSNRVSAATIALENFDAIAQPLDLSDVIAQTDIEMKRLGWTNVQGREYIEKTYGKRSRQHLTDEELLSFLLYLEEQPSLVGRH